MVEKRVFPRHRVLKAGTIEFGGGAADCTIRKLSNTGGAAPVGIPEKFTLVMTALPCRLARISVSFIDLAQYDSFRSAVKLILGGELRRWH